MFELIIKCSKDVKKLVIDFGDSESTLEVSKPRDFKSAFLAKDQDDEQPVQVDKKRDVSDILAERASSASTPVVKPKVSAPTNLPTIDLANRPPSVDEDMQKGF